MLLRATKDRRLWKVMIAHTLKEHGKIRDTAPHIYIECVKIIMHLLNITWCGAPNEVLKHYIDVMVHYNAR